MTRPIKRKLFSNVLHACVDGTTLYTAVSLWPSTNRFMNVSGKTPSSAMTCLIANGAVGVLRLFRQQV